MKRLQREPELKGLIVEVGVGLALGLILCGTSHAQMATEIMPGVTHYGGANGGTLGVEIIPGYRRYQGEVEGGSVELMPGSRRYSVRPSEPWGLNETAPRPMMEDIRRTEEANRQAQQQFWNTYRQGGMR